MSACVCARQRDLLELLEEPPRPRTQERPPARVSRRRGEGVVHMLPESPLTRIGQATGRVYHTPRTVVHMGHEESNE